MKMVVCIEPDEAELVLNDLSRDDFICDPDTYYYFRDQVFLAGIKKFINQNYPGNLPPGKVVNDVYSPPDKNMPSMPMKGGAGEVARSYDTQDVIVKYYKKYKKKQPKYYLYKGDIYSFALLGFINVGNEIQLIKYEPEDLLKILNGKRG